MKLSWIKKCTAVGLATILCVLSGCGDNTGKPSSNGTITTKPGVSGEVMSNLAPDNPVNMGGYEFILVSAYIRAKPGDYPTAAEQLFFMRKERVEAAYNCKITVKNMWPDPGNMLPKILAGNKVGDVVEMMPSMWIPAVAANIIVPWDDVPGIDISDDRWVKSHTDASVLNGKHYGLSYQTPPEVRGCMFYNKDLLRANGITEDLAQLVRDGHWTFDKFREYCKTVTKDTNSDGVMDTFGLLVWDPTGAATMLASANGSRNIIFDENGKAKANLNCAENLEALNFYDRLVNQDKVVKIWDYMNAEKTWNNAVTDMDKINFFKEGKAAFIIGESWLANSYLRSQVTEVNYGFLPLPKGPQATDYVSPAGNMRVFTMTSTNKDDLDKSVTIFNALAYPPEGYEGDWWMEDIQTEYFQDNDTDSVELYAMALDRSIVDPGSGITAMGGDLAWEIANSVFWHNETITAAIQKIAGSYDDTIANVFG